MIRRSGNSRALDGLTESRVSQLHTKAIMRLKAHLSGATREPAEM
jgi:hypothetical protein